METPDFFVRFWGVRGSIACGGPETARYGGNTSSLEIRAGGRILLFDAGTGLRGCGKALMAEAPLDFDLFLTHSHLDHVNGLPFFVPFFDPRTTARIHAGHLLPDNDVYAVMCQLMCAPLFPVPPSVFGAKLTFCDFRGGDCLAVGDEVVVRTLLLNHPDQAVGYRVDFGGKSICYLTDLEHAANGPADDLVTFVRDADILIYDSMFSDEQYKTRAGWGHSTWGEGIKLADAGGVRQFVAFHHDPDHDDAFMDTVAADVDRRRPGSLVAREGLVLAP